MKHSEQLNEIAKAMSGLQSEIKDAEKDIQGHGYKYADLYQVLSLIRPLLLKYCLSFTQHIENADDKVLIETMVIHTSGQWFSSVIAMPPTPSQRMSAAQSVGSAITYGRRYALTAIFGITQTAEDTDAQQEKYEHKESKPVSGKKVCEYTKPLKDLIARNDKLSAAELWQTMGKQDKLDVWPHFVEKEKDWIKKVIDNMPKQAKASDV